MKPAAPQTRSRVADIWRALACLGVVFFHGSNSVGDTHPWLEPLTCFFGHSGPRLSIFFVVAGYCLALSAERRSAAASGPLEFFRQRFLRLYPVYWAALLFALTLAALAAPFNGRPLAEVFPATPRAWLAELTLTQLWLGEGTTLVVAWFLDHLVALSLIFGLALAFRSARGRLALYAAFTALAHLPAATDWLPALALWPHFACGVALALAFPSATTPARPALLLYPLALGLLGLGRGDTLLLYSAGVALLFGICLRHRERLPSAPPALLAIATASYSIYLVHVPVMSPALNLAKRLAPSDSLVFVAAWVAHLGLGVGAGLLFHRLVEAPLQRRLSRAAPAADAGAPCVMKKWIHKLLRAGRPERPSRLHTGTGQLVPPRRWPHLARALASWLRLRLGGGCAVRPWLSYAAVRRLAALLPPGARALEIGAGQSTLWLAPRCSGLLSIEADEAWFRRLGPVLAAAGHAHVDLQYRWHGADMVDFSTLPDHSLDFILVDGGPRSAALRAALPKLKPGGLLYVDNTDEPSISGSCRADLIAHAAHAGGVLEFFPDFSPCTPHATEGVLWRSPSP